MVLTGIVALAVMIRFPTTEGRAAHLDLLSIYADPFILCGYAASIPFFVALYKAFKLLGYIGNNEAFSQNSVRALISIQHCVLLLSLLILLAGIFIKIFHNKDDDPAGFLALCMVTAFAALVVAAAVAVLKKILQSGINIKLELEQLNKQVKP